MHMLNIYGKSRCSRIQHEHTEQIMLLVTAGPKFAMMAMVIAPARAV